MYWKLQLETGMDNYKSRVTNQTNMALETSAGALIFRKEDEKVLYLVLLYGGGHWDLAKGHIENDETPKETAIRECEEETGIKDLNFVEGFKESISYLFKRHGKLVSKDVVFLLAETKTKDVNLSFEHKDYKWLSYEDARDILTYPTAKNVIEKADKFLRRRL